MLCDPEILILDEPANGLDPEGVRWLRDLLRTLAGEGRTVLVSSHILAEVAQTVDTVIILDRGLLVTHAALDELTARTEHKLRVRTPQAERLKSLLIAEGASAALVAPDRIEVSGASAEQVGLLAVEHVIPIFETTTDGIGLEDVFFQLTDAGPTKENTQ
jgi:ABC-2 type transport system ATP-binding protein